MKIAQPWRLALPLTIVVLVGLIAVFFDTARSIVNIWNNYETFTHGYIIVPVCLWLIWLQRANLARATPHHSWFGLFAFAAIVFVWLLGSLSGAQVVKQYAFAAMFPATVLALLGWQVARIIRFPLMFILLAVPFGDAFIEPLMNQTADFTVLALQLTGIPVFREGNTLTISSGVWSVVEACSGVRYLIASLTLGIIYAYLTYRSIWRQILFIIASIVVPIVANGVRAYMIVMIGHLSNMEYAVGVDHLIYGWVFFGVVMLLLFWVGSFWREDTQPGKSEPYVFSAAPTTGALHFLGFAALVIALAVSGPYYTDKVARKMAQQSAVVLPELNIARWQPSDSFTPWRPEYKNPSAERLQFLQNNEGVVGIYIGYYRNQVKQSELITYGNVLASPGGQPWRRLSETSRTLPSLGVRQNILAHNNERLLGYYWYWTGNGFTTNSYIAKAQLALNRLLMRPDDSAVIAVFAPFTERPDAAAATLEQLVQDALPTIQQQLAATRQQ